MGLSEHRLVLVSNAEPFAHHRNGDEIVMEKLAGGLTSALDPLMREFGGVWIAWGRADADFEVLDSEGKVRVPDEDGYELRRLKLSEDEVDGFYLGFSNEILWPLCHSLLGRTTLDDYRSSEKNWKVYRDVNRKYAEAVLEELEEGDLIWIHDYHLLLVPKMIRENRPEADIAFFWHIPWPSWEIFGTLPWRGEVMEGLLASDFIGFHTSAIKDNFLSCAKMLGKSVEIGNSIVETRQLETKVSSIPLGIDCGWFNSLSKKEKFRREAEELREKISAKKIIVGVDRLDYTKGIPERLRAFELFLEENPEFQGEVTLVQRVPPSRSSVEEYQSILNRMNRIIGEINGRFEKPRWSPIKSFHRFLPSQEQLIPYYLAADVGLVTPLADGMNLVSKEYLACTEDGVLILSEFAGAAEELKEAIHVNPYNIREVAKGIEKALTMSQDERRSRLEKLKERIRGNDIERWRRKFLEEWLKACEEKS